MKPISRDPDDITRWQRIDAEVTTSGWLMPDDVSRLDAIGVRHVINLSLDSHPAALINEEAMLGARDIAYTHIPVPFEAPEEDHFERFCAAFSNGERPVHIHCIANWRVAAFLYRYHRDHAGMPEPDARKLMEQQWSPADHDHPDAPAWARFIAAD